MTTVIPRQVICALGHWQDLDEVDAIVQQTRFAGFELDREFSQLSPDDRMMTAFDASCDRVSPSMSQEDWDAVQAHRAVAYVLSPPIAKDQAIDVSSLALLLTAELLRGLSVAVRTGSSQ